LDAISLLVRVEPTIFNLILPRCDRRFPEK
jgi:hypothetical protein